LPLPPDSLAASDDAWDEAWLLASEDPAKAGMLAPATRCANPRAKSRLKEKRFIVITSSHVDAVWLCLCLIPWRLNEKAPMSTVQPPLLGSDNFSSWQQRIYYNERRSYVYVGKESFIMKNCLWRCLIVLFAIFGLAACEHDYPLVWSPDGNTMALVAEDGLRLGDAQGNLTAPISGSVDKMVWLPDSKRLLITGELKAATWAEGQKYLSEQQQKDAISLAKYIKDRLASGGESALDEDQRMKASPEWMAQGATLYLMATDRDALKSKTKPETFAAIAAMSLVVHDVRLQTVRPVTMPDSKELWRGFDTVENLEISPDGNHALLVRDESTDSKIYAIDMISLGLPGSTVKVAETRTPEVAWSADSRSILFSSAAGTTEDAKLGSLVMVDLLDQSGAALQEPKAQRLARICLEPAPHIHVLKDGRILFTTSIVRLPATESDIGSQQEIFSFAPGDKLVRRLMSEQDSEAMWSIESLRASADQTLASIACKIFGNDVVQILNIGTGNINQLSFVPKFQPSWRNADEICFTKKVDKPGPNQHTAEVVLHSVSKNEDRVISANWPKSAVDGFLIENKKK